MSDDRRVRKVLATMDRAGLDALIALSGDVNAFQPNAVMLGRNSISNTGVAR